MKTVTLSEIKFLQTVIANRKARVVRILDRVKEITTAIPGMNANELADTQAEIEELANELAEHAAYCNRTEKLVKEFYKPAYRAA